MSILLELSGESLDLARSEAEATASTLLGGNTGCLAIDGPVMFMKAPGLEARKLASRLGLAHHVSYKAALGEIASGVEMAADIDIGEARSFRVRVRKTEDAPKDVNAKELESSIGALVKARTDVSVDLSNPEAEIRVVLARQAYAGLLGGSVDRKGMDGRAVKHRPFSRPVSIHPKLARVMVNLARVPEGGNVMDPLCGTGGILIEASMMGYETVGSDIDPRMVKGSRKNLDALGLDARLEVADVTKAAEGLDPPPDAIVTDPPYGRSTSLFGRKTEGVLDGLYGMAASCLHSGSRLVVCLPNSEMVPSEDSGFEVESVHPMKVHRSLTRHVCVLIRTFS